MNATVNTALPLPVGDLMSSGARCLGFFWRPRPLTGDRLSSGGGGSLLNGSRGDDDDFCEPTSTREANINTGTRGSC